MTLAEIEKTFRDQSGRALATLIRLVGDFDLAEDVLQEAFAAALERWPAMQRPANPRAWLVNVARNKAIDRVRRQINFRGKQAQLTHEIELNGSGDDTTLDPALDDDTLRLIFICCHPAFAAEVQVALTLRTIAPSRR
jgi:RNA polymerase sigma-70 factor, ECF subfamily